MPTRRELAIQAKAERTVRGRPAYGASRYVIHVLSRERQARVSLQSRLLGARREREQEEFLKRYLANVGITRP